MSVEEVFSSEDRFREFRVVSELLDTWGMGFYNLLIKGINRGKGEFKVD